MTRRKHPVGVKRQIYIYYDVFGAVKIVYLIFVNLLNRFQKDFDLSSSYNNLVLTSHSVYKEEGNSAYLDHQSYFTHSESQTKAFNTIHYSRGKPEGESTRIAFKHDIKSHVLDLSTDATYQSLNNEEKLRTLQLKINSNSSMWNMLNLNLDRK